MSSGRRRRSIKSAVNLPANSYVFMNMQLNRVQAGAGPRAVRRAGRRLYLPTIVIAGLAGWLSWQGWTALGQAEVAGSVNAGRFELAGHAVLGFVLAVCVVEQICPAQRHLVATQRTMHLPSAVRRTMNTPTPVRVICLPFAGAGTSFFRPWNKLAPDGIEFAPLYLPGRERLLDEKPFTDLHAAADSLLSAAAEHAEASLVALLGHCFLGATLAYEICLRLVAAGYERQVRHLFVSAARAPFMGNPTQTAGLSDDDFLDRVRSITGYTHPAMDIPEMRDILMGALRADFQMDEGYAPVGPGLASVPVTAVCAVDDEMVPCEAVVGWKQVTQGLFRQAKVTGGHMYVAADPRPLIDIVVGTLSGSFPAKESPDAVA
jgi:surfactin synthase thioesterase subunit